ncbi:hypothetical protein CMV_027998 [Castanea mollissima]|uniref:Uncharacterized protein n=1 Tax=Castanea mollissima TaxID=60419 RepID=A0A8J4QAI6_9ROSI|nr:hypothetical protein CMV_027998 [Castanea mollissima]
MATGATYTSQENGLPCEGIIIDITRVGDPKRAPECCIYKVPKRLRKVNEQAYTPKLISIGPVHHNKGELKDMQMVKERYFKAFFSRISQGQKEFARIIESNNEKICECYAPEISLHTENVNFVKMVLLDSIFIIELFVRSYCRNQDNDDYIFSIPGLEDDYILSIPGLRDGIMQDLILLENQLPFFILDKLYQHHTSNPTFLELACNYFFSDKKCIENEVKHFTDLQRNFFLPPKQITPGDPIEHRHNATKLDMAGLIFQNREEKEKNRVNRHLLEVEIQKGNKLLEIFPCFNCSWLLHCLPCLKKIPLLESMQTRLVIPHFVIDNKTEDLFRNLMALEQCHYPDKAYICNYILLLDFLINSKDDVELLVEEGIIVNSLGSNKAVADMVNKLGHEIVEENSYYYDVAEDLNKYYRNWWNKNMESLKTVYFRDIWRGTATVVGIIVLVVTVLNFLRPFVFKHI